MKKRRWIYITVGILALLICALIIGARSNVPDLALVDGVKPLYTLYGPMPKGGQYTVYRFYTIHVPYDQAVQSALKDPMMKKLNRQEISFYRTYYLGPEQINAVFIGRGETIEAPKGLLPSNLAAATDDPRFVNFLKTVPDPHGWVTVTTDWTMNPVSGALHYWMQKLSERFGRRPTRTFFDYSVMPKQMGMAPRTVDVYKGTVDMEGKAEVRGFSTVDIPDR